ncbi:MAG TPA: hypothetical protein VGC36_16255 [Rhizomicrobium sp.]
MTFAKSFGTAAALCLALGATSAFAQTVEPINSVGCLHMEKKASAALEANQQSPNYYAARGQARGAQNFCAHGIYKDGINGYTKVLELLGAS